MRRIKLMNTPMDSATMTETVDRITERIHGREFTQHVVVNVAKMVNMRKDSELEKSVKYCDIINIDGMGVVWAARLLGHKVPERVTGIDLFFALNERASHTNLSVFYLGATEEVVTKAVANMQRQYDKLNIAGYHHGYFWDDEEAVVKQIKASGANILFVAVTSPKKERFINKWKQELGVQFVMGVGGTFDIVAGKTKRAPKWVQDNGFEWAYRLMQEPKRMWKRYLSTNSKFAWMLIKAILRNQRVHSETEQEKSTNN